jgi:hypothetical protein
MKPSGAPARSSRTLQHTMRFPLIRKNRSILIGNLGLFWIYLYGLTGKRIVQYPIELYIS